MAKKYAAAAWAAAAAATIGISDGSDAKRRKIEKADNMIRPLLIHTKGSVC
jgi:uncharacterized heparinase superfamily protein